MEAQKIAVDAVVALTDCDRDAVTAFIRRLYLAGVKDPKRLTLKGLHAMARPWRPAAPFCALAADIAVVISEILPMVELIILIKPTASRVRDLQRGNAVDRIR